MIFITSEVFAENKVYTVKQEKKDGSFVLWIRLMDLNKKLGIKNVFAHIDKEIKNTFKDSQTKEQINKYKRFGYKFDKDIKHL